MAIKKGVSAMTHTQKQLDDYANQHNPTIKPTKPELPTRKGSKSPLESKTQSDRQRCSMNWG